VCVEDVDRTSSSKRNESRVREGTLQGSVAVDEDLTSQSPAGQGRFCLIEIREGFRFFLSTDVDFHMTTHP
jgi:hypothetical protein